MKQHLKSKESKTPTPEAIPETKEAEKEKPKDTKGEDKKT